MSKPEPNKPESGTSTDDSPDRLTMRLSAGAKAALKEIKDAYGLSSNADAIRIALGTERRMVEAFNNEEHVLVADRDHGNVRELVFSHWPIPRSRTAKR